MDDREWPIQCCTNLADLEFSVFYDMSEQHRILAEDLEDFLGPIYRSNASYVIAVLGREYGKRRWTRFESEQFEELFGENRVIPVWSKEAMPTAFDVTDGIGGTSFDPAGDLDAQASEVAELCARKLDTMAAAPAQTSLL